LKIARRKTGAPAEKSEQAYGRTRHPGEKRKKLADSAVKLEVSTGRIEDSADRRTELAATRTLFAAERTYNVWVRTGLLALASGIGAKALLTGLVPGWLILANGSMLVLFSMFCFGAAVWRQLNPGLPPPIPTSPRISPALLVTINGFLALVSLFALFGVWFDRLPAP
jgi:putative membrane protein